MMPALSAGSCCVDCPGATCVDDGMSLADRGASRSRSDGKDGAVLTWLLQGDPSIRWQVLADLMAAAQDEIDAERARVAAQGWGARLLAAQSADGQWAHGLYSPK